MNVLFSCHVRKVTGIARGLGGNFPLSGWNLGKPRARRESWRGFNRRRVEAVLFQGRVSVIFFFDGYVTEALAPKGALREGLLRPLRGGGGNKFTRVCVTGLDLTFFIAECGFLLNGLEGLKGLIRKMCLHNFYG